MATTARYLRPASLHFSNNADANRLAAADPAALLIGFLLDQQQTVQKAFEGPWLIQQRVGTIEPAALASMPFDDLHAAFQQTPAIHRFHGNMAKRVQQAMRHVVDTYGGDPEQIWLGAADCDDLMARLEGVPGIGRQTALTFSGVLAQRFGLAVTGWEEFVPTFGSLGAVDSPEAMAEYQERKRAYKKAKRAEKA